MIDCSCSRGGNAATCEHNDATPSWMDRPSDVTTCGNTFNPGCGASYTAEQFAALPRQRTGNGLIYADCKCGSTLCREVK